MKPMSAKRKALAPIRRKFVADLLALRPMCEFPGCTVKARDVHETKTRARGGPIVGEPTDTVQFKALCRRHHDWVDVNQVEAHQMGLLRHSWE